LQVDRPEPKAYAGEALLRVLKAGVCNTDLELVKGYMSFRGVLGHEFVGRVERADDAREWVGRRVAGEINLACHACAACRAGRPTQCPNRTTLGIDRKDGVFADYVTLPIANLHAIPDVVTDEQAVFVEPLAAACEILQQVSIKPTDTVVVIGDGKLGLLCAQVLQLTGCHLTAVGRHAEKLDVLARRGVRVTTAAHDVDRGADVVVEATGNAAGFATARELVRPRGTIVLKSTYQGEALPVNLTMVVVDEVMLIGSRCGPFPAAIRLLEQELVDVDALVQARFGLDDGMKAMERAGERGMMKVIVEVGS
jgi:threonine dehydrogenase-like Zn-dependent dehydrogenase